MKIVGVLSWTEDVLFFKILNLNKSWILLENMLGASNNEKCSDSESSVILNATFI